MNQPTPFAALGAVARYALQQMAPPPLRPFQAWLTFATSAAPCEDAALCSCATTTGSAATTTGSAATATVTASRPTGRRDHSSSPASARA
ncbi:hypothetical protein [Streptomyces mirabilis]|uniref:Uncharacterized protein n=1 Tax=Streptomyces mirabilis TaxID=68239 RepID=A0ABU3V1Q4_9ACTN|nr:hypothetical protein [Streptomyces mirabilis]MDU9000105.1 hypothetical protein [Streptomyces mirabilis]SOE24658.1 hypothetical protein SAMN05442782_1298 [Streptomyces sp. OK228]